MTSETLRLYRDSEIKEIPPPEWQIEGIIQSRKLVQVFGQEDSLKSFLALLMAYSIAHGVAWAGRETKQGSAVYLYMEGGDSLQLRRDAWKIANGIRVDEDADIYFLPEVLDLMDDGGRGVETLIASIEEQVEAPPDLIIVDTLSRAFGSADPNTPKDMNRFVHRCDRLRSHFDGTVLVLHHTGWDTKREASARNLRNACDTVIKISRANHRTLEVKLSFEKQKGAPQPKPLGLTLLQVQLEGEKTSLAVPRDAQAVEVPESLPALRTLERLALMEQATYTEWKEGSESRGINETTFKRDVREVESRGYVTAPPSRGMRASSAV